MSIEPLQNLLTIYGDKKKVLLHYLSYETTKKLDNHEYVLDLESLFLNDKLILIKKSTGKIYKYGVITKITDEKITIKNITNKSNLSLAKDDYYIFRYIRKNKSKKDNRLFYEELLKSLN